MPKTPKKKVRGVKGMSYARLVDEIAKKLQKLVRLKAADENGMVKCWTSGESRHWKEMQGGHFISRKHQRTKIMEENITQKAHPLMLKFMTLSIKKKGKWHRMEYMIYQKIMVG